METPLAYPLRDWCKLVGISVPQAYIEIKERRLHAVKRGRRTLIRAEDSRAWLESLDPFVSRQAA